MEGVSAMGSDPYTSYYDGMHAAGKTRMDCVQHGGYGQASRDAVACIERAITNTSEEDT